MVTAEGNMLHVDGEGPNGAVLLQSHRDPWYKHSL